VHNLLGILHMATICYKISYFRILYFIIQYTASETTNVKFSVRQRG